MKKRLLSLFLAFTIALTAVSGCAQQEVFRLIRVEVTEGDVDVARGAETYDAFVGMDLVSNGSRRNDCGNNDHDYNRNHRNDNNSGNYNNARDYNCSGDDRDDNRSRDDSTRNNKSDNNSRDNKTDHNNAGKDRQKI